MVISISEKEIIIQIIQQISFHITIYVSIINRSLNKIRFGMSSHILYIRWISPIKSTLRELKSCIVDRLLKLITLSLIARKVCNFLNNLKNQLNQIIIIPLGVYAEVPQTPRRRSPTQHIVSFYDCNLLLLLSTLLPSILHCVTMYMYNSVFRNRHGGKIYCEDSSHTYIILKIKKTFKLYQKVVW